MVLSIVDNKNTNDKTIEYFYTNQTFCPEGIECLLFTYLFWIKKNAVVIEIQWSWNQISCISTIQ